jgi:hypothetical protein
MQGLTRPERSSGVGALPIYVYRAADGWIASPRVEPHFEQRLAQSLGPSRAHDAHRSPKSFAREGAAALGALGPAERDLPICRDPAPYPTIRHEDQLSRFPRRRRRIGPGAATASMLVAEGAKVVVADLNDAGDGSRSSSARTQFMRTDVTDETANVCCSRALRRGLRRIHGAINCAGSRPRARRRSATGRTRSRASSAPSRINLVGTFNVIRLAAARMSTQPASRIGERGVIVNTSLGGFFEGQIGQAAYAARKRA